MTTEPKRRRWRPRFRLSTLLLLMTLVAVLAAWAVDHRTMQTSLSVEQEQKEKLAIDLKRQQTSMPLHWLPTSSKVRGLKRLEEVLDKTPPVSEVVIATDTSLEVQLSAAKDRVEELEKQIQLRKTLRYYDSAIPGRSISFPAR